MRSDILGALKTLGDDDVYFVELALLEKFKRNGIDLV
jgi:hypothetical protein